MSIYTIDIRKGELISYFSRTLKKGSKDITVNNKVVEEQYTVRALSYFIHFFAKATYNSSFQFEKLSLHCSGVPFKITLTGDEVYLHIPDNIKEDLKHVKNKIEENLCNQHNIKKKF